MLSVMKTKVADLLTPLLIVFVGFYQGVVPFIAKFALHTEPLIAFPAYIQGPGWWVASLAAVAVTWAIVEVMSRMEAAHPV